MIEIVELLRENITKGKLFILKKIPTRQMKFPLLYRRNFAGYKPCSHCRSNHDWRLRHELSSQDGGRVCTTPTWGQRAEGKTAIILSKIRE